MTNLDLAELFARKAEESEQHFQKALKRAARSALDWPVEATSVESLQTLAGIGPVLERLILEWLGNPQEIEPHPLRSHFLSRAEARRILAPLDRWVARGDLHMHTVWSDGSHEIEDMADAAHRHGYQYLAITDHTKALKIANGLDEERLANQRLEIAAINAKNPDRAHILRSAEVNLTPRGELDLEPDCLAEMDLVLACFHSKLRLQEDQTGRYLAALRNPHVHILGHPRGRVYNFRLGLQADWERVFGEAAELDKAVEIDCFPDRQDLDWKTLEIARRSGVRISLGTDAHAFPQLANMEYGLAAAWKAGIPRDRILNFLPLDELLEWAAQTAPNWISKSSTS